MDPSSPLVKACKEFVAMSLLHFASSKPLPTILLLGDQSAGKSSLIRSLIGLDLPCGIPTRVPVIIEFEKSTESEICLKYGNESFTVDSQSIEEKLTNAMEVNAGTGNGISKEPVYIVVKNEDTPNFKLIELPGITRVPVLVQKPTVYADIVEMMDSYAKDADTILLNVVSASQSITSCESINISKKFDQNGERTFAVITKCDLPDVALEEMVNKDEVNIGLGYVLVGRNEKTSDYFLKTYELMRKLFFIQHVFHLNNRSLVLMSVNSMLNTYAFQNDGISVPPFSPEEALISIKQTIVTVNEFLLKALMGDVYSNSDSNSVSFLASFFTDFTRSLDEKEAIIPEESFLIEEINLLKQNHNLWFTSFPSSSHLKFLIKNKCDIAAVEAFELVNKVCLQLKRQLREYFAPYFENLPNLWPVVVNALEKLTTDLEIKFKFEIQEHISMEKLTNYSCHPDLVSLWNKLLESYSVELLKNAAQHATENEFYLTKVGLVSVRHLKDVPDNLLKQGLELHCWTRVYWNMARARVIDLIALRLRHLIQKTISIELEKYVLDEVGKHELFDLMADATLLELASRKKNLMDRLLFLQWGKIIIGKMSS